MRQVLRVLGWLSLILALLALVLTAVSWPPGGLLFALPYLFLGAAALLGAGGFLLLLLGRAPRGEAPVDGAGREP